jgi:hypothetical protein
VKRADLTAFNVDPTTLNANPVIALNGTYNAAPTATSTAGGSRRSDPDGALREVQRAARFLKKVPENTSNADHRDRRDVSCGILRALSGLASTVGF